MTNKYKSLFLKQGYEQALSEYKKILKSNGELSFWDIVVLTASNDHQAECFDEQINSRIKKGLLPKNTRYLVIADPDGKRVGSGGATLNVLREIAALSENNSENSKIKSEISINSSEFFYEKKILCIHSGGDSKRVPQYSVCGKLFSPVPRQLPDGSCSTLFDEFMIGFSALPSRMKEGMLVCSGDVLLMLDPTQLDLFSEGAAALSIKADAEIGTHHGVYTDDGNGNVGFFLHKRSASELKAFGAIDQNYEVDIDTGAVLLDADILSTLYNLVNCEKKASELINDCIRLSFYTDFTYPMSAHATLEEYLKQLPEGEFSDELIDARLKLWNLLSKYKMRLIRLSPASFLHFGTTSELLKLMTEDMDEYSPLGWRRTVNTDLSPELALEHRVTAINSHISQNATVSRNCYIENSYIGDKVKLNEGCIISGVTIDEEIEIPKDTVLSCVKLQNGKYTVRIYAVSDNPKLNKHFDRTLDTSLWNDSLFPVCEDEASALRAAFNLYHSGFNGAKASLISLEESFVQADTSYLIPRINELTDIIFYENIIRSLNDRVPFEHILGSIATAEFNGALRFSSQAINMLTKKADALSIESFDELSLKLRIYKLLSELVPNENEFYTEKCFSALEKAILHKFPKLTPEFSNIPKKTNVKLPLRVNFGGGWTDTPPYCIENGGTVLNVAIAPNGELPIEVTVEVQTERRLTLISADRNVAVEYDERCERSSLDGLFSLRDIGDPLAIIKASLIICGIIPCELIELFDRLKGGLCITTNVKNIPHGSGLGTSSILCGGCVLALCKAFNISVNDELIWNAVLCIEQMISTGGGWQDQIGGMTPSFKLITSQCGIPQQPKLEALVISEKTLQELEARFALVSTGQRRYSKNLLRDIMGKYLSSDIQATEALKAISKLPYKMKAALESDDIQSFAELLNEHWSYSVALDDDCTNACIDEIFRVIQPLICGQMICGAGGGGYLQVILKNDVPLFKLQQVLNNAFGDNIYAVGCKFI